MTLLSLLLAMDNPKVNYFSLDIEGAELQVLRSVPWHLVDIEVFPLTLFFLAGKSYISGGNIDLHYWCVFQCMIMTPK